jgi:glycosyltransferase involved in cell wall biosynthesis
MLGSVRPIISDKGANTLLIDLRITQIAQRERGIVRYTTALALALAQKRPRGTVAFLIDPEGPPPDAFEAFRTHGAIVEGTGAIGKLPHVSHYLQTCFFELSKTAEELFPTELWRFRPRISTVVYDVIPWIFPQHYLENPAVLERYRALLRLNELVDHHFAISERTRQDMIAITGTPGARVTTVYGGVDEARWAPFRDDPMPNGPLTIANSEGDRFVLDRPYWLYVGGGDFRKNIPGLVEAFARLLAGVPGPRPMLVIACSLSAEVRAGVAEQAAALGLVVGEDLVMTGFVDDPTLARCYRRAFATVFPSLYEGLGLPVLESYYFGVPAIASGTTSLAEITAPECRFDPTSAQDIARAMRDLHADPARRAASVAHGRAVLGFCDWHRVADVVGAYMDRED